MPGCDVARLRAAWLQAVQQLSILRTSFHLVPTSGQWVQAIHSVPDFKWSTLSQKELGSAAGKFIASLSLDNESSFARPPVYFRQVQVSTDDQYIIVVLHHALYDGVSIPKLLHYVRRLYRSEPVETPSPFNEVADAILIQEEHGLPFWSQRLKPAKPFFYLQSGRSSEGAWRASTVIDLPTAEIQRFCRRYHVHPQTLGQATWAKILCMRGNSTDVVFGHVVSGRSLTGADNVIGPVFVSSNTTALSI